MPKRKSRNVLTVGAAILVGAGLTAAFWPQPMLVDTGVVRQGAMIVTVDEEARTRVRDAYIVSTPIAGRLMRVDLQPGDFVERDITIVAHMLPINPAALDARSREQVRAAIAAADASLRVAQAEMNRALADRDLAKSGVERARKLFEQGITSKAALDQEESRWRVVSASVDTARAAISLRVADLEAAQAQLISFDNEGALSTHVDAGKPLDLPAPISGRILRIIQQSETTLQAGVPILEIGDTEGDLEIVVELLSTDAVRVSKGDRVIISNWGRPETLNGVVERIDPWGFTKFSALGVEEQRVNAVIQFVGASEARSTLGHGFRVETRIVVWENDAALIVPSAALFRDNGDWAVFVDEDGGAQFQVVSVGQNNGIEAEVLEGLDAGQSVVLYPSAGLTHGTKIANRSDN